MPESLIVHNEGRIVTATINRERARNALNDETLMALHDLLQQTARQNIGAIVLTGAGLKAFSAGSDIKEMAHQDREQRIAHTEIGQTIGDMIEQHPAVVIAAIEGFCLGGGLELAMACDYRIAGDAATLGLPEIHLNALPSWGGTVRLPRLVGVGRARELILFGRKLNADEAVDWGLIHRSVPAGTALNVAQEFAADHVNRTDRGIVAIVKSLITHGVSAPTRTARQLELLADMSVLASDALEAGVSKFTAKT